MFVDRRPENERFDPVARLALADTRAENRNPRSSAQLAVLGEDFLVPLHGQAVAAPLAEQKQGNGSQEAYAAESTLATIPLGFVVDTAREAVQIQRWLLTRLLMRVRLIARLQFFYQNAVFHRRLPCSALVVAVDWCGLLFKD
ncbi:MAG: hypothetical protein V1489_02480 [Candidatus Liptonbacteria bacterium]